MTNGKGWKGEPRRHGLARRGVKTVINDHHRLAVNNYVARGKDDKQIMINQLKMIYGDGSIGRLLYARLERTSDIESLSEAIQIVGQYNGFNPEKVAEELMKLHKEGAIMDIEFGRESSPVMYIHLPYWKNQSSNAKYPIKNNRMYTNEEINHFENLIKKMGYKTSVDEINESSYHTYRLWWD